MQGPAATNVPERIYGVIDLYGQAAQVAKIRYLFSEVYKFFIHLAFNIAIQATIIDLADLRSPDGLESTVCVVFI